MLCEKLRALRQRAGVSQQKVADAMGVTKTAVYKWENGQAEPDLATIRRLAAYFAVSLEELCDGEPDEALSADAQTLANIALMTRAFRQLTSEEQEKFLAVGRALFEHAFREGEPS